MAHKICFFDLLPVELLHSLFAYFLAHEIFFSFSNVSDHVDTVLLTYSSYRLDFKSILKSNFDLICHQIRPDQVLSLTLSDDDDTPGQSELFFSHFRIEHFIRLQSLTLFNIELDVLELIFSNLNKLDRLRSFSFHKINIKRKYPDWIYDYTSMVAGLNRLMSEVYIQVLPKLNRLSLSTGDILNMVFLQHLRCLILAESTVDELQMIFTQTPRLKSLDVCLNGDLSNIETLNLPCQLNRLTLTINDSPMSMDQMERFLPNLSRLKYLTLQIKGSPDLADGHRWEQLSVGYILFNFKIQVYIKNIQQILDSFRTPFWLRDKRWYVSYDYRYLFSVPKFAVKQASNSYNPQYFTAPDKTFIYKNITKLDISELAGLATLNTDSFDHVQMLEFHRYASTDWVSTMYSFSRRVCKILSPSDSIRLLLSYLHKIPRCQKLSINVDIIGDFINKLSDKQFEQIRTLEIRNSTTITRSTIEGILYIFPHVECLRISPIISNMDMIRLIDGFKYLSNASFTIQSNFTECERNWVHKPELSIRGVRRLENGTFTCRFNRSSCSVHIWIH